MMDGNINLRICIYLTVYYVASFLVEISRPSNSFTRGQNPPTLSTNVQTNYLTLPLVIWRSPSYRGAYPNTGGGPDLFFVRNPNRTIIHACFRYIDNRNKFNSHIYRASRLCLAFFLSAVVSLPGAGVAMSGQSLCVAASYAELQATEPP